MKKINGRILWPTYLDYGKSRSQGRRIPKRLAIKAPTIDEISEAAEKLGLKIKIYHKKAYPKTPYEKTGLVLVLEKKRRNEFIKEIAETILQNREKSYERFK
ncbi:MAG: signal recognition particle subunit SRP19/SEC65 family protein [Candidatus Bathyarchaeia archaeon]